jgi:stage II sporulation protein D
MRKYLILIASITTLASFGQPLKVRLFSSYNLSNCWVTSYHADYHILATDANFHVIDTIDDLLEKDIVKTVHFKQNGSHISIYKSGEDFGKYQGLYFVSNKNTGHFIISGKGADRIYNGNLFLRVYQGKLQIINEVELESYVAGVVESEGGHVTEIEYFKAQAVLARTWVLKNKDKHIEEGYNVKDNISSQAYYSKAYLQNSKAILQAVAETKDSVLLDKNDALVFGAFHSNSGGQTSNSEDIWSQEISYLRSVPDSFSLKGDKATWEKKVEKTRFYAYFANVLNLSKTDTELQKAILAIQMDKRKPWFDYNGKKVKMRNVRTEFKLKSSYFSVEELGDYVLLKGRGFGHGVGLSQQGAMEMARQSFNYKEILKFYFQNTHLGVLDRCHF